MTQHEQKPESAEFRTREEQLAFYPETLSLGRYPRNSWQLRISENDFDPRQLVEGPVMYVRCDIDHKRRKNAEGADMSFAWLVEDVRKKDKSAPPLARFDMLFGNDEVSISEARERLKALGIESLYVTDEWADATEGNELSCEDIEALPPLHEDEQKAGWKLASAWDTEDGEIVRHYVRPLRISDQGTANVAALVADAVAAERERCAKALDKVAKQLAGMLGGHLTEEGIAIKEACAARVEQEAAAIREGGEHG